MIETLLLPFGDDAIARAAALIVDGRPVAIPTETVYGLAADVCTLFRALPWPGNVRQLLNVIRNVVVLNDGGLVTTEMLPASLQLPHPEVLLPTPAASAPVESMALDALLGRPLAEVERLLIEATLARHNGSVPKAARVLDLSPSTLYRKIEAWTKQ